MSEHTGHLGHAHHQKEDPLLTVREVARKLRVDDTTCRRWVKQGSLKAVALPHAGKRSAYRIKQSELDKILAGEIAEAV